MALLPFKLARSQRFEQLVRPHLAAMYRFAFRLAGQQQDAEDLVQDVIVKLYPRLEEMMAVTQLRPWLNRVLYRQFVDSVRRRNRRAELPFANLDGETDESWLDSQPADLPEIPDQLDAGRLAAALNQALLGLTPDQRTLILLYDVDGWSQEEVAMVLEVPLGTVKSRIHRCRAMLRKKLQASPELLPSDRRVTVSE